jgi:hypothetical protein|tara:strand:- start:654 stop:923 length:270 start_codon:yes stop_codon:yes gene_type:complete
MTEEQARAIANDIVNQLEDVGLINSSNAQWAEDLTTARLQVWVKDAYKLVLWPESQAYMDERWFETEAVLADADQVGEGQAYFIPIEYT